MNAKTIGLVIPAETQFFSQWAYNYYFTEVMRGAVASASLFDWNILIHHRGSDAVQDYVRFCEEEPIDGVMCMAPNLNESSVDKLKEMDMPVIVINSRYPGLSYVDTDNTEGAKKAAGYLWDMGHRRIAIINGDLTTTNARDRYEGYKKGLNDVGLDITQGHVKSGKFTEDFGSSAMEDLLAEKEPPTAVLCANDLIAIGAIKTINKMGLKIPEDISVVGFDDLIISGYLTPPLTTVRQPLFHLGKEAVITLMSMVRGEKGAYQEIEIETRLIVRDSVADLREDQDKEEEEQ
jgi:DNA-binding LacI/PurR family transcriptional regulator